MRASSKELVHIWRELRQPFALCPCMRKWHVCKYEAIDAHLAGCTVCGFVHDCTQGHCMAEGVIETGDSIVCSVTGLCVRETVFCDAEFVDTVASYGRTPVPVASMQVPRCTITEYVRLLLDSESSRRAHALEQTRWKNKVQSQTMAMINNRKQKSSINLVTVLQTVMARTPAPCLHRDAEEVGEVTVLVSTTLCRIINTCINALKMNMRPSEIKIVVFGLCYLMRSGVNMFGVAVIPKVDVLKTMLPPENALSSCFAFRAKHITDVENKIKFLFRGVTRAQLRELF
mgnify:CR=1 FL=1